MRNIMPKIIFSSLSVLFSTSIAAACLPIQGTVQTQAINESEQVGQITMTSSAPLAFRRAFGQIFLTGGIKGTITAPTDMYGRTTLEHQIGFPGIGSIISDNDIAQVTGGMDADGNLPVTETVAMAPSDPSGTVSYGGVFTDWTFRNVVAIGTINISTGSNTFTYSGQVCN